MAADQMCCLSVAVLWMGGAEKRVPADLLLFVGEDQLEATEGRARFLRSGTQASTLERRHVAAVQAAAEDICRGRTHTCQRPSLFAFLPKNLALREDI